MSRSVKGTNKNIVANFDKIWLNMFQTGRDTSFGWKTQFFTLKIEIRKKCISWSVKGANKNIIANFEEIWLNIFRTGRDTRFGSKNAVFHLKNWNRKKLYQQKCKGYQHEHYCQIWRNLVEHDKFWV